MTIAGGPDAATSSGRDFRLWPFAEVVPPVRDVRMRRLTDTNRIPRNAIDGLCSRLSYDPSWETRNGTRGFARGDEHAVARNAGGRSCSQTGVARSANVDRSCSTISRWFFSVKLRIPSSRKDDRLRETVSRVIPR